LPTDQREGAAGARARRPGAGRGLRLGIGGPVGSGKTTLIAGLCRALAGELSIAVILNDASGREDAELLLDRAALEPDRIVVVRTGCDPQAAIRDDIAANLEAAEALERRHTPLDLLLLESGGADLSAVFSSGLVDRQVFVIDAAAGERVPRKGGAGVTASDLLVVNKTDLAAHVGADLEVMRGDAVARRGGHEPSSTLFTSLAEHPGAPAVADWVRGLIAERDARAAVEA
jgi:urease accessory protein